MGPFSFPAPLRCQLGREGLGCHRGRTSQTRPDRAEALSQELHSISVAAAWQDLPGEMLCETPSPVLVSQTPQTPQTQWCCRTVPLSPEQADVGSLCVHLVNYSEIFIFKTRRVGKPHRQQGGPSCAPTLCSPARCPSGARRCSQSWGRCFAEGVSLGAGWQCLRAPA